MKETSLDYLDCDDFAVFTTAEKRWINRISKLATEYPEEVKIVDSPEDNHGYLVAHVPKKWFKINPPRRTEYSEEQRMAIAERLRASCNVGNS